VRNSIGCNSYHLKIYQKEVSNLINKFKDFNIKPIPHIENFDTDMLANVDSNNDLIHNIFSIELICALSIHDNNQRIVNDEQKNMDFM